MTDSDLATIPLIDVGSAGALGLLDAERTRAEVILSIGRRRHGRAVLHVGDRVSRTWLLRSANPYTRDILAIAARLGQPGAIMLNMSFEWTCTSGASADPSGGGNRLARVLDWPMDGLGRHVVVARETGPAGAFYNVTWPGAVGVLTAMAPGRFSAAINQAPMRTHGLTLVGDWARNRVAVWHSRDWSPAHLLRRVLEHAQNYETALDMLCTTKLALPVLFTLSGVRPDQGCVIERTEQGSVFHPSPAACANDWLLPGRADRPRGRDNTARRHLLTERQGGCLRNFDWVVPPILNSRTRLAVTANADRGSLEVLGFEHQRPATAIFTLASR